MRMVSSWKGRRTIRADCRGPSCSSPRGSASAGLSPRAPTGRSSRSVSTTSRPASTAAGRTRPCALPPASSAIRTITSPEPSSASLIQSTAAVPSVRSSSSSDSISGSSRTGASTSYAASIVAGRTPPTTAYPIPMPAQVAARVGEASPTQQRRAHHGPAGDGPDVETVGGVVDDSHPVPRLLQVHEPVLADLVLCLVPAGVRGDGALDVPVLGLVAGGAGVDVERQRDLQQVLALVPVDV